MRDFFDMIDRRERMERADAYYSSRDPYTAGPPGRDMFSSAGRDNYSSRESDYDRRPPGRSV